MATELKALLRWMSMPPQNFSKTAFISALGKMVVLVCKPARLKVLVAETQVMVCSAISGERAAVGVWCLPWKIRSEWISSETSRVPFSMHSSAIFFRSEGSHTSPNGLWGLHSRKMLHCLTLAAKSSKSTCQRPFFSTSWFSTTVRSQASTTS